MIPAHTLVGGDGVWGILIQIQPHHPLHIFTTAQHTTQHMHGGRRQEESVQHCIRHITRDSEMSIGEEMDDVNEGSRRIEDITTSSPYLTSLVVPFPIRLSSNSPSPLSCRPD